jgi:hypothetical protein
MSQYFEFADAWWFRGPLRLVTLAVAVFGLLSLYPALVDSSNPDHLRAIWGFAVLGVFVFGAVMFMVSISDCYVELDDAHVSIRFESFFNARFPIDDIDAVRAIEPRPGWRYRWGLSTNWRDRISCSHGGQLVEIELSSPQEIKLWPRTLQITRFWVAVRGHEGFVLALEAARSQRSLRDVPTREWQQAA